MNIPFGRALPCALILSSGIAAADELVVTADRDNTLYQQANGLLSNGAGDHLFCGVDALGHIRRGLVHFDVSAVPSGAIVSSATLELHLTGGTPGAPSLMIHRVVREWGEAGSDATGSEEQGAPAEPGDATWTQTYSGSFNWINPGGDFIPIPSATTLPGGPLAQSIFTSGLLVSDVQAWVDEPGGNFGWLIAQSNEMTPGVFRRFGTKDNSDWLVRPTLIVEYFVPPCGGIPFCPSTPNSTDAAAVMSWSGSCVLEDEDFSLHASPVPNQQPGLFFFSMGQALGVVGVPFGSGVRCVGYPGFPTYRLPPVTSQNGALTYSIDFGAIQWTDAQVASRSTWYFQAWFRDPASLGPTPYDLSGGLEVLFH